MTTGSFMGRGNRYIQLVKPLYCKPPTISKQPASFPYRIQGFNHRSQRWEVGKNVEIYKMAEQHIENLYIYIKPNADMFYKRDRIPAFF